MNVADVIAELSKLSGHLPVVGVVTVGGLDEEPYTERCEVTEVRFEGAFVALECDGAPR